MTASHFSRLTARNSNPVYMLRSKDAFGRPCFYVLMCTPDKLKLLLGTKRVVQDLQRYAQVLASGFGSVLPESVRQKLSKDHGLTFND